MATIQDLGKVAYFNKGIYNSETTYEINDVVSYNGSSYVSLGNDNLGNLPTNTAFWSIVASKGDKGDTGKAFVIEKTYASIEDMVDDYDNMNVDDYVMIQGSIEDEENATLWTKTDTEVSPYKWVYLADFSGASGITGATPNIQIGTVTEGNQPSVTRRAGSTNENPILDFVLKTGAKGDTGATGNGISGVTKTSTSGLTDTYTISYTSGNSSTFDVHNGKGISSIAKTTSIGLVDTYTITYNDGTTSTFDITNGEDGSVTQEQLDETNEEVERVNMVYNALPKVSGESTELSLNNTAECPVYEVGLRPSELEQESTTGKNILNIADSNILTTSSGGSATRSGNNVLITLASTANNGYVLYMLGAVDNFKGKTLTFSLKSNTNFASCRFINCDNAGGNRNNLGTVLGEGNTSLTYEVPNETFSQDYLAIRLYALGDEGATYLVEEPMVEVGSTATEYEEYTGGQPSPSPEFPQDIHVVSGDNSVKISNKNLFDKTEVNTSYLTSDGTVSSTSSSNLWRYSNYIEIKPNTSYITSGMTSPGSSPSRCYYDKNKNFISGENHSNRNPFTSISPNNAYYMIESMTASDLNTIQIEQGSAVTEYVEHQEQNLPISLGDLEYCKIGDYEDEFYKATEIDTGLTAGKWYLKKNIGKVVLDGSEYWSTIDDKNTGTTFYATTAIIDSSHNTSIDTLYSNYFKQITNLWTSDIEGMQRLNQYRSLRFKILKTSLNEVSVDGWKAWLSTHNTIVYYILATPTYTLLNNTLQAELDNLSNAISYSQQTNVYQTNADLPFVIKLSAIRDLSGIFELI